MSIDRQYPFIPWHAVYTSATALLQRSVTHQQFSGLLAKLPATKTLVLLDSCSRARRIHPRAAAGPGGAADRDGNGTVEVRELADYIEAELPKITAQRIGQEQYPFSSTEGHTFPLLRKP